MDMKSFQDRRKGRHAEAARRSEILRQYCTRCLRPDSLCFCGSIHPLQTRSRFLFLPHPKETKRVRNGTGRLASLHLKDSFLFSGIDFSQDERIDRLIEDPSNFPFVLYPGPNSTEAADVPFKDLLGGERRALFILIDGTWRTAKKILTLSQNLHSLFRLAITPTEGSKFWIRSQPRENCVSTIESAYYLLEELQTQGIEDLGGKHIGLMATLGKVVEYQLRCTESHETQGYRKGSGAWRRKTRIRPQSRNPFF